MSEHDSPKILLSPSSLNSDPRSPRRFPLFSLEIDGGESKGRVRSREGGALAVEASAGEICDEEGKREKEEEEEKEEIDNEEGMLASGWRSTPHVPSLEEIHSSVKMPPASAPWHLKLFAFTGLGFVISVGYMDPGNWATDISGGSSFGYSLLSVVLLSNLFAMLLQSLALKLGVVAERDLAQACHDAYPSTVCVLLWLMAEVAIMATDLAESIGSATALYLLFGLPIWAGVLITSLDVFVLLMLGMKNARVLEAAIGILCLIIALCFAYELAAVEPDWGKVLSGFVPQTKILTDSTALYNAIGILGATVMPHNLYLHSALVQTRDFPRTRKGKAMAIKYGSIDSCVSLLLAFFVNASILILAAAAFHYGGKRGGEGVNTGVAHITDAYRLIAPAVGSKAARILFGVALLASGQNSTITGTLAGQVVMEGFIRMRLEPWLRRTITRLLAIVPALIAACVGGNEGAGKLLILSQVILSIQLTFAVVPLVHFTSSRKRMGDAFVNSWLIFVSSVLLAALIAGLNVYLVISTFTGGGLKL